MRQVEGDALYRVLARGLDTPEESDAQAVREYFNLAEGGWVAAVTPGTAAGPAAAEGKRLTLTALADEWASRDKRFCDIRPYFPGACSAPAKPPTKTLASRRSFCLSETPEFPSRSFLFLPHAGARMLRQDPVECLFQFICSSNNHISRIHGMVERLCSAYGTRLHADVSSEAGAEAGGGGRRGDDGEEVGPVPTPEAAVQAGGAIRASQLQEQQQQQQEQFQEQEQQQQQEQFQELAVMPTPEARRSEPAQGGTGSAATKKRKQREGAPSPYTPDPRRAGQAAPPPAAVAAAAALSPPSPPHHHYAFPTLEQLSKATEEELRAAGFGCVGLRTTHTFSLSHTHTLSLSRSLSHTHRHIFSHSLPVPQVPRQVHHWLCRPAQLKARGRPRLAPGAAGPALQGSRRAAVHAARDRPQGGGLRLPVLP
jgi:hypothetical protein